jgi:prepilin-type processing-associated H-X9-DG protein
VAGEAHFGPEVRPVPRRPSATDGRCAVNCTNDSDIYAFHPGGANIAMMDGSVRLLRQTIDITVVAALLTKGGGENVPGE